MSFQVACSNHTQLVNQKIMAIPKVKGRMFAIQAALPKFPVAPLQQTMDTYLRTCEPLLTDEEFARTKKVN